LGEAQLSHELKQQMIDLAQVISDQTIGAQKPSPVVVQTLFGKLKELSADVTTIAGAAEKLHEAWNRLQAILGP
jgi:hypothetical protein